ncbi:MAG: DEAD/DEAH box helicase family protein [Tenericutes bacterium]|nr:DEAD/DEAH box helicase family protein [Mycoplasmatota bacterium]
MDFSAKIDFVISRVNNYDLSRNQHSQLIIQICDLFSCAMTEELSQHQLSLLYFLSNLIGVPQYFDLLCKLKNIQCDIAFSNNLIVSSLVRESFLFIDSKNKVHIFQKEIIDTFSSFEQNRYIISAPTSFGKTFIVFHIIKKMKYENIVLIFPTISLLSENLQRLLNLVSNSYLRKYKLITLSEEIPDSKLNIFVFTPERFMTFIDKNPGYRYDFVFMDELYKIDNEFLSNDENFEITENNRDISFRIALEMALFRTNDCLLAGPFLHYSSNETMINFVEDNGFVSLIYNDIELVQKIHITYKNLRRQAFDNIEFKDAKSSLNKGDRIAAIIAKIAMDETIVYCPRKHLAEEYAIKLVAKKIFKTKHDDRFDMFIEHLERNFTKHWCLVKALKAGIGIHHGTIPKYIQREIIDLFNNGLIKCIFSTTTITEGVNTTAKNMIILSHKKGIKDLKKFDVLNIIGRAGRFNQHFVGRVFILDEELSIILDSEDDILSHKNYGKDTIKSDLDLAITKEKYLSGSQSSKKQDINENYNENDIPQNVRDTFLTIFPDEKIKIYKLILQVMTRKPKYIPDIIENINHRRVSRDGLQLLIDVIRRVIPKDDKLYGYTEKGDHEYSVITFMLNSYMIGGFPSLLKYEIEHGTKIDTAVRKAAKLVYNIFRYELVKHIGLIDLVYRTIYANIYKVNLDEVNGFSSLLSYLEYGAYSEKGRKVSDYGVSQNLLKYIDNNKIILDDYEKILNREIEKITS